MNLKLELESRGFLNQYTHEDVFPLFDAGNQTLYVGMDPTADSLHMGNFVAVFMNAVQYMKRGNKAIFIIGGATGMVGDPGGKNSERTFLDEETLQSNVEAITEQVGTLLAHLTAISGHTFEYEVVNNLDFYRGVSFISFLRDVGKNITINQMMNKETVKRRITDPNASISYTEFSYMLMQGYDYLHLFSEHNCKLQIAGSDQRGNIVTGIELIRKMRDEEAYGITCPLLLDSTGKKFGKSEGNALWLNPKKTTPYAMYQYFLNTADEDIARFLKILTLLSLEEIDEIVSTHNKAPHERFGQKKLAEYVITTVFGSTAAEQAEQISALCFGQCDVMSMIGKDMKEETKIALREATGSLNLEEKTYKVTELLTFAGVTASNGEAKKLIKSGAIYIQEEKIVDIGKEYTHTTKNEIGGTLIRKGKKKFIYGR